MNTGIEGTLAEAAEPTVEQWRVECMNDAGEIRVQLYEGWERDEANQDALRRLRAETGDPSWTTILLFDDRMEAPR